MQELIKKFVANCSNKESIVTCLNELKNEALRQWENKELTDSEHCSIEALIDSFIYNLEVK